MGNQATAMGLIAASKKSGLPLFYGTYPITPASDILHELAKYKNFGVRTFQAEDEIAAICSVIGAAFGAIVGAVVDNIIMPIVGMITGGINFDALSIKVGSAELKYGMAISALVKFLAIALFLFMVIKAMNASKKKQAAAAPPPPPEDITLLREIRDALKR